MKRHRVDVLSLTFGILFLAIAGASASRSFDVRWLRFEWLAAFALLVIGASLLLSVRRPGDGSGS